MNCSLEIAAARRGSVLLLPGLDGTGRFLRSVAAVIEPFAEPVVLAYPSDRPLGYAELAELVSQRLPRGPYAIVAESFSGPIAVRIGASRPAHLRGILLSTSFVAPPFPRWLAHAPLRLLRLAGVPRFVLRRLLLDRNSGNDLVAQLTLAIREIPAPVLAARLRAVLGTDATEHLRACTVPLVYLAAADDRILRGRGLATVRRAHPGVESVTIPGPHMLLQARPHEAGAIIRLYVERWCVR